MPILRIDKAFLGTLLFGNDEIIVERIFDNNPYIDVQCKANPDLGLGDETFLIEFRTDVRIISRNYRKV